MTTSRSDLRDRKLRRAIMRRRLTINYYRGPMSTYMVFAQGTNNERGRYWLPNPVGVFSAKTPEDACIAAAQKSKAMTNFFAVEGTPWGLSLNETTAEEYGVDDIEDALVERAMARVQRRLGS